MDLAFSQADQQFRTEVRQFLADRLPADIARRQRDIMTLTSETDDILHWMKILAEKGWSVPHWDPAYGGTGWTPMQMHIFSDELNQADAPEFHWVSTHMAGPIIYKFGSQEQKDKFLPAIRGGEYIWCQGFSEPGAGSDLASLKTSAVLQGGYYRVNGQKIWTSGAFEARWGFFLVKSEHHPKAHQNISFLLIDMQSPGITVRRIPQISGESHVCEVFLEDVIVPVEHLVGEPGKGWGYAKALLEHERTVSSFVYFNKRELRRAKDIAGQERLRGKPLIEDPEYRMRLSHLDAQVSALEWSVLRVLANEVSTYGVMVPPSVLKLTGSRLQQTITELQVDMLGFRAARYYDPYRDAPVPSALWPEHIRGRTSAALTARAATIYGGTEQIQKNILSKTAFNL
ncbi:MAG TPA: acyl-CoA dehydrogenase family protein [Pseudomonas sp.]|nr:acyl-CoA dehydrogenase family protein [Pseudomonas sp.]